MEENNYLFKKPLNQLISNKKLLISLLILIVLFFPIIIILGVFLPLFNH